MMRLPLLAYPLILSSITAAYTGWQWRSVQAQWDRERLQQSRAAVVYLERAHERQAAADAAKSATLTRLQVALQKARHEPMPPVECPASGDVLDADLPGMSLRLRLIRDSATSDDSAATVVGVR